MLRNPPNRHRQRGFIASIIGAGASLLGGALASRSSKRANDSNQQIAAANNAMSDAQFNKNFDENVKRNDMSQANYEADVKRNEYQFKDLQQNSIQHRVRDAIAAGVHPLYAIGASSSGASPAQAATPLFNTGPNAPNRDRAVVQPNDGLAKGIAGAGRAAAGYMARNSVDAKLARAAQIEQIELTGASAANQLAQAEWYKRRGVADTFNSMGRDTMAYTGAGMDDKLSNQGLAEAIATMFKGKMIPRENSPATDHVWTQAKDGSSLGKRPIWSEDKFGELGQFATAIYPWIEQIFSRNPVLVSDTVARLKKAQTDAKHSGPSYTHGRPRKKGVIRY